MPQVRRTKRTVELVIETTGQTGPEHDQKVLWATRNAVQANQHFQGAFVAAVASDEGGSVVMIHGGGSTPSPETAEIIRDLMDEDEPTKEQQ